MRLAVKGALVAVGVVLLIAGGRSPRGTATAGGSDPRGVVSIVTVAQDAVPGATVRAVERETNGDDTPHTASEVELVRPDGTTVEVELGGDYKLLSTDQEDDRRDDD
jgi:hypothetical protein